VKRIAIVVAVLTLGLCVAACEGDTDPATNVTNLSARLNFTGHANSGPAFSYFEYWKTSTSGTKFRTPTRSWPAGAQGSFGERVTGLTPNTSYSFRVCGGDQGEAAVCRTTRSFTTLAGTRYVFDRKWSTGAGAVAVDSTSNVYVTAGCGVRKFTSSGRFITQWGGFGFDPGQFACPSGVATHSAGHHLDDDDNGGDDTNGDDEVVVYVVENPENQRVQKFTSSGGFIRTWGTFGTADGEFFSPRGIATDPDGNVYVVEAFGERVQKFTATGGFLRKWGSTGSGDGQFSFPQDLVADSDGNVYVADTGNIRIQKFTATGGFLRKWGSFGQADGQFDSLTAVGTDSAGAVYTAETTPDRGFAIQQDRIQKFTATGGFIIKWGSFGSSDGQFDRPAGVAVDAFGNVYVADAGNERIQRFRPVQ
jgi:tripartite motif-containing protein 71